MGRFLYRTVRERQNETLTMQSWREIRPLSSATSNSRFMSRTLFYSHFGSRLVNLNLKVPSVCDVYIIYTHTRKLHTHLLLSWSLVNIFQHEVTVEWKATYVNDVYGWHACLVWRNHEQYSILVTWLGNPRTTMCIYHQCWSWWQWSRISKTDADFQLVLCSRVQWKAQLQNPH